MWSLFSGGVNSFTSISPLWRRGCGGQAKQTTGASLVHKVQKSWKPLPHLMPRHDGRRLQQSSFYPHPGYPWEKNHPHCLGHTVRGRCDEPTGLPNVRHFVQRPPPSRSHATFCIQVNEERFVLFSFFKKNEEKMNFAFSKLFFLWFLWMTATKWLKMPQNGIKENKSSKRKHFAQITEVDESVRKPPKVPRAKDDQKRLKMTNKG